MPAAKHSPKKLPEALPKVLLGALPRALIIGLSLSLSNAYADSCTPSSVNFMHITGEEDLSAMGQIASLAGSSTHSGHVWESSRKARVQLAAKSARVGEYAPQSINHVETDSAASPDRSGTVSTKQPATTRPVITGVSVDTSSSSAGVRSISKPQIKAIKIPVTKRLR